MGDIPSDIKSQSTERVEFSRDEERRLLRKFDLYLLPPLTFMYLCNALDKGNVGNAQTDGWAKVKNSHHTLSSVINYIIRGTLVWLVIRSETLSFQFAIWSPDTHVVFFTCDGFLCALLLVGIARGITRMLSYATRFGTPISLLVKHFSAARVLPVLMIGFGSMALFTAVAKNFSQIFAIRFMLGIFESPVLPGVLFYLSTFYKRNELASRVGLFYAASSIAGAFSGLIAFGAFHIHDRGRYSWQFLFWIEGSATVAFAIFALFWLPFSPQSWRLLSAREEIARARILADSSVTVDEKLNIRDAFRPLLDPVYWLWALICLSFGVPLASVNNFLPQIVASLGYSTVKTNLLTVAPNVAGTVALIMLTFSSDYFRERSFHICIPLATGIVGFIVLGNIDPSEQRHLAYFACFLLTMGAFAPSVLVGAWNVSLRVLDDQYSNNTPSESRRAVVAAVMVAIANSAGLISTNVFRAQDAPKYVPALATSAAFGGFCLILVASTGLWMRWENRRRNREQGTDITPSDIDTEVLGQGPRCPSFRYMY